MIVYAVTQYDHDDYRTTVREIHSTRRGAQTAACALAREEHSRWPEGEYVIEARYNDGDIEWLINTTSGSTIESWTIKQYDLIDP